MKDFKDLHGVIPIQYHLSVTMAIVKKMDFVIYALIAASFIIGVLITPVLGGLFAGIAVFSKVIILVNGERIG